jgi:hypothetical protein
MTVNRLVPRLKLHHVSAWSDNCFTHTPNALNHYNYSTRVCWLPTVECDTSGLTKYASM